MARDAVAVDRGNLRAKPFCTDANGIECEKDEIPNARFNHKSDYLREKHDRSADGSAIKEKACACTQERGCTKPAAVHLIEQNDKRNPRNHAKDQILKKDHDSKRSALTRFPTRS